MKIRFYSSNNFEIHNSIYMGVLSNEKTSFTWICTITLLKKTTCHKIMEASYSRRIGESKNSAFWGLDVPNHTDYYQIAQLAWLAQYHTQQLFFYPECLRNLHLTAQDLSVI